MAQAQGVGRARLDSSPAERKRRVDQEQPGQDVESKGRDLVVRVFEFVLGHIVRTGDNPSAERAQALLDELREAQL
jgi:hypothetical protein